MMEFIVTLVVIAFIFVAATVVIAMVAGALMKAKGALHKHTPNNLGSE